VHYCNKHRLPSAAESFQAAPKMHTEALFIVHNTQANRRNKYEMFKHVYDFTR